MPQNDIQSGDPDSAWVIRFPKRSIGIVALGLVVVFFNFNYFGTNGNSVFEIFKAIGIPLPPTTQMTLFFMEGAGPISLFLAGIALILHAYQLHRWIVIFMILLSVILCCELLSLYLPWMRLMDGLRKK